MALVLPVPDPVTFDPNGFMTGLGFYYYPLFSDLRFRVKAPHRKDQQGQKD